MLSFKPTFSLSTFTFIKKLFSSSSLSAIRVISSAHLRLLIFLLAILIPACASSSPAFLMMYSDRKSTRLNSSHHSISYAVFCLKKKQHPYNVPHHSHPLTSSQTPICTLVRP